MNDAIQISPAVIGGNHIDAVSAKQLHEALGAKSKFADWIRRRIDNIGYTQDVDFLAIFKNETKGSWFGSREVIDDYLLTLDMAKELCMLERNDKGRQFRRYFIEREREAIEKGRYLQAMSQELLNYRPLWRNIQRYANLGLNNVEIGRLCGRSKDTVRSHRRKMEACGLLKPPANLKQLQQMQQMNLRLLPGGAS